MGELTSLQGIGTATELKLRSCGIETLKEMAALDDEQIDEIAGVIGVDSGMAQHWRDEAREMVSLNDERIEQIEQIAVELKLQLMHEKHRQVRVRVLCEQGILASRAVWRGEVHKVLYWQYQQAACVNPDGYELLD